MSFDNLLISTCDVYKQAASPRDAYNQPTAAYALVTAGVKCRVSSLPTRGRVWKTEKQPGISYTEVFMRPYSDGAVKLNKNYLLLIAGQFYEIIEVRNPGFMEHHYEVMCSLITE